MMPLMTIRRVVPRLLAFSLASVVLLCSPAFADKKKDEIQKPIAGPRATALRVTWLYISPDLHAQKVDRVQPGREMVVAEKSGPWLRVYANTDIMEAQSDRDAPLIGSDETPPPISGWMEARGVVVENTPDGDKVVMGEAADQELAASDPRGPAHAAQIARLLYRRVVEMFPNSPLAPEAAWRAADIRWQLQKADASSRPSAKEQAAYMRDQMDEDEMKKILKLYPHTRQAAMAAFDLIDNKRCGDWQGQEKCPAKEAELYEHYTEEYPDGPRTAQALYLAAYRSSVLVDMFKADNNDKKAEGAKAHALELTRRIEDKFPQTDYAARAADLAFKLNQGIPIYGIDME